MYERLEIEISSEAQTVALGSAIGRALLPEDVVLLEGELGIGKTRLAKGIVSAATGVSQDEVVSPTFTLINSFQGAFPVHHADLYRVERDDLWDIGLEDTVDEGGALIVEWGEKIHDFGEDALRVQLLRGESENSRHAILEWNSTGSWPARIDKVVRDVR